MTPRRLFAVVLILAWLNIGLSASSGPLDSPTSPLPTSPLPTPMATQTPTATPTATASSTPTASNTPRPTPDASTATATKLPTPEPTWAVVLVPMVARGGWVYWLPVVGKGAR